MYKRFHITDRPGFFLALPSDCTVAGLRKEMGPSIGGDSKLYTVWSSRSEVESDTSRVFQTTKMPEFSLHYDPARRFEGSYDMTISIEARRFPDGQRLTKTIPCRSECTFEELLDHIAAQSPDLYEIPSKISMHGKELEISTQGVDLEPYSNISANETGQFHRTEKLASLGINDVRQTHTHWSHPLTIITGMPFKCER